MQGLDSAPTAGQVALFPTAHVGEWTPSLVMYFPFGACLGASLLLCCSTCLWFPVGVGSQLPGLQQ